MNKLRTFAVPIAAVTLAFSASVTAHAAYGYGYVPNVDASTSVQASSTSTNASTERAQTSADTSANESVIYDDSRTYSPSLPVTSSFDVNGDAALDAKDGLDASIVNETTAVVDHSDPKSFVKLFLRPGSTSAAYDNDTLETSEFDFGAYVSHECFTVASAAEAKRCQQEFGPYADLRTVLSDGTLSALLMNDDAVNDPVGVISLIAAIDANAKTGLAPDWFRWNTDGMLEADASGLSAEERDEATVGAMTRDEFEMRSRALWDSCGENAEDALNQRSCFQDRQRLLQNNEITLEDIATQ